MALRISKITKEMKEFKLLKKMLKKGYIQFYAGSEIPYIVFSSSSEKDFRMCSIRIENENKIFFINQLIEGHRTTVSDRTTEFSSMNDAFKFAEDFVWDVLPKTLLKDVLEIGSYNV